MTTREDDMQAIDKLCDSIAKQHPSDADAIRSLRKCAYGMGAAHGTQDTIRKMESWNPSIIWPMAFCIALVLITMLAVSQLWNVARAAYWKGRRDTTAYSEAYKNHDLSWETPWWAQN